MSDDEFLDVGDVVLLDAVGARCVTLSAADTDDVVGVVLDLEGRLNKLEVRDVHRYVMSAGMAAELIAEVVIAAHSAGMHGSAMELSHGESFRAELEAALLAEQKRRRHMKETDGS